MSDNLWDYFPKRTKLCIWTALIAAVSATLWLLAHFLPEVWFVALIVSPIAIKVVAAQVLTKIRKTESDFCVESTDNGAVAHRMHISCLMRASVKARVVLGWTAATIVLSCISMDSHASEQFAKRHMVPKYAQFVAGNEAGVEKPVLELRDSMPVLWIMYNLHIYLWLLAVIFTVGFAWTEFESEEFRLDRVLKNQGDLFV